MPIPFKFGIAGAEMMTSLDVRGTSAPLSSFSAEDGMDCQQLWSAVIGVWAGGGAIPTASAIADDGTMTHSAPRTWHKRTAPARTNEQTFGIVERDRFM